MVGLRRLIAGSAGTLLVGMFAGFVLASAVGVFIQDSGLFGASGESPIARAYMLGLLQRDPNSIVGIRPNQSIAQRAAELQGADTSRTTASIQPLSLTYIGVAAVGSDDAQALSRMLDSTMLTDLDTALQPIVDVRTTKFVGAVESEGRLLSAYVVTGKTTEGIDFVVGFVLRVSNDQVVGVN